MLNSQLGILFFYSIFLIGIGLWIGRRANTYTLRIERIALATLALVVGVACGDLPQPNPRRLAAGGVDSGFDIRECVAVDRLSGSSAERSG